MKILFPLEFGHTNGGMVVSTLAIAKGLAARHSVMVACPKNAEYTSALREAGVITFEVGDQPAWSVNCNPTRLNRLLELRSLLRRQIPRPDLVCCNNLASAIALTVPTKLFSAPLVYTIRGDSPQGPRGLIYRYIFSKCSAFTSPSHHTKSLFSHLARGKPFEVICNPIDAPRNLPSPPSEYKTIRIIGHLNGNKNQLLAIRAFEIISETTADLALEIVGSPASEGDTKYMKALLSHVHSSKSKGRVKFLPFDSNHDTLFNNCDIVLSTSLSEGFGRTLAEGMMYGRLVIACAKSGGPSEIITHNETGLLYPDWDPEVLAGHLIEAHDRHFRSFELAKNGQEFAVATYSPSQVIKKYCQFLEALA
jgi:glycosyltransferase involved in cell wall biosynthesis